MGNYSGEWWRYRGLVKIARIVLLIETNVTTIRYVYRGSEPRVPAPSCPASLEIADAMIYAVPGIGEESLHEVYLSIVLRTKGASQL